VTTQLAAVTPTEVERATGLFQRMPSIPRLFRDVIVTEKIDGTNASIFIGEDGAVHAASRTRWITPQDDNYGFARWVAEREDAIRIGLGVGHHFGEWYGSGIQRGYGLKNGEKRFALFNVQRWYSPVNVDFLARLDATKMQTPPSFMEVVPILGIGVFDTNAIMVSASNLLEFGSVAVPGFMRPEGIVVYHKAGDALFKYTFDKNDGHKGER